MHPLVDFLDRVERPAEAAARRRRSYELLGATSPRSPRGSGAKILDAGCGAGTAVGELAALGCVASGVDINEGVIEIARERVRGAKLEVGNVESLAYGDASLDGYRAERLYQHLADPVPALAEAKRVLAPGGRVVLIDQDWDTVVIDSDDDATTHTVLRAFANGIVSRPARRFHRLLRDAGFTEVDVVVEAVAMTSWEDHGFFPELFATVAEASGALPSAAAAAWLADQRARGESGRFFMTMVHCLGCARS